MGFREIELELDLPPISFEVEYSYSYTPGKYSGRPEDCYPEEEESEIVPKSLETAVQSYLDRIRPMIFKAIDRECEQLALFNAPGDWVEEAAAAAAADKAEYQMEERKYANGI